MRAGRFSIHPTVNVSGLPDGYTQAHIAHMMPFQQRWLLSKAGCSTFIDC